MFAVVLRGLFAGAVLYAGDIATAESASGGRFTFQAAILLENGEPISEATMCFVGEACQVFADKSHGIALSLKVSRHRNHCLLQELTLDCAGNECSFYNGWPRIAFSDQRQFEFFEGSDHRVETLLVLRNRAKIGRILVIIPVLGRLCAAPSSR
jgi:hypothetical protein